MFEVSNLETGVSFEVASVRGAALEIAQATISGGGRAQMELAAYLEGALMMWDIYKPFKTFTMGGFTVEHSA